MFGWIKTMFTPQEFKTFPTIEHVPHNPYANACPYLDVDAMKTAESQVLLCKFRSNTGNSCSWFSASLTIEHKQCRGYQMAKYLESIRKEGKAQ